MVAGKPLKKRVGRSVATKPKTLTPLEEVIEDEPVHHGGKPYMDSEGMTVDPAEEARARAAFDKEKVWLQLAAGWNQDRRVDMIAGFIRSRGLFEELVAYTKKEMKGRK